MHEYQQNENLPTGLEGQSWRESVARHLKTADDLFDSKPSPRTESLVAAAEQWAERIMRRVFWLRIRNMATRADSN